MDNKLTKPLIVPTDLTPIEIVLGIDDQGRTTAKRLYGFLELDKSNYSKWAERNIKKNEYAEENVDYIPFVLNDERNPNPTTDYKLTATFAKKLAMGTHNLKGEAAKNYFIKVEDKLKEIANPQSIEDLIILQAQSMKDMRQQLNQVNHNALQAQSQANEAIGEVQAIRDVMAINPTAWRKEVTNLLNKIAKGLGGTTEIYQNLRNESYKLLDERAGANLSIRLTNRKRKVLEETGSRSKADKVTKIDVIGDDKKLTEVYLVIVKEMAIRYKVA